MNRVPMSFLPLWGAARRRASREQRELPGETPVDVIEQLGGAAVPDLPEPRCIPPMPPIAPARVALAASAVALLRELLDNEDVAFYASAIESSGPRSPDFEAWAERARALVEGRA